jgi:hypothetical protein
MSDDSSAGLDAQRSTPVTPVTPLSVDTEHESDVDSLATAVPETVMAEQVTKDVVKEAQSVGRPAPIDDTASTTGPCDHRLDHFRAQLDCDRRDRRDLCRHSRG